uniref:inhibin alpha chain-like n=1 Tax=Myxine glutinosa TaxID=7769 RepID=UPI00358E9CE7
MLGETSPKARERKPPGRPERKMRNLAWDCFCFWLLSGAATDHAILLGRDDDTVDDPQAEVMNRTTLLEYVKMRILDSLGRSGPVLDGQALDSSILDHHEMALKLLEPPEDYQPQEDAIHIALLPLSDPPANATDPNGCTFCFKASKSQHGRRITSAKFWYHASGNDPWGDCDAVTLNLIILGKPTSTVSTRCTAMEDHWVVFEISLSSLRFMKEHTFCLQLTGEDLSKCTSVNLPFLLITSALPPVRRHTRDVPIVLGHIQKPVPQKDCKRLPVSISFEELEWAHWIIHPKNFTFYFCRGVCTSTQNKQSCCAPVPGSLAPLHVRTTSDGGYTYRYENVPRLIPQECVCFFNFEH